MVKSNFHMTLKNGFGKCLLFVLSARGWKDQNMASSFSCQRKPKYGEGIVRLASRVAVWHQSINWFLESSRAWSFFTQAFAWPTKSHARLNLFDKPIKSLYFH